MLITQIWGDASEVVIFLIILSNIDPETNAVLNISQFTGYSFNLHYAFST